MKVRIPWNGLQRRATTSDDALIGRLGLRLALLLGMLLVALVVVMSGAVYFKAQSDLLQPWKQLVSSRGTEEVGQQVQAMTYRGRGFGGPPGPGGPPPFQGRQHSVGPAPAPEPAFANTLVYDTNGALRLTHASPDGPRGSALPSPAAARRVLDNKRELYSTISTPRGRYLLYTCAIRLGSRVYGVVQVATDLAQYDNSLSTLLQILLLVGLLGLMSVVGITLLVVRRALRPIRLSLRRQRDFVADAAHELRTPLTIIRSAAELSIADSNGEEQQRAELTLNQTVHLTRLVSDLSLLARADTGTLDFARAMVDLSQLVSSVVSDMDVLTEERGVSIEAGVLPGIYVTGDSDRLRQVLLILLDNAIKHTPEAGRIHVGLTPSKREALLRIVDSGPGIDPEDEPHVFERFYQSDRARSGEGTGLGLAIAQSIVEAQSGHISAGNAPGGGAIFTVYLPLAAYRPPRRVRPPAVVQG